MSDNLFCFSVFLPSQPGVSIEFHGFSILGVDFHFLIFNFTVRVHPVNILTPGLSRRTHFDSGSVIQTVL